MNSNNFVEEVRKRVDRNGKENILLKRSKDFMDETIRAGYSYNFSWMGRPIIQYPQDMVAIQEIIWEVKPDLIIETGIAHGGSLIMSASMLAMLDYCEAVQEGKILDPTKTKRKVLGVDIDIRPHNKEAIEKHPMSHRIEMIQGSSVSKEIIGKVKAFAKDFKKVMVLLDSNHTHDHVLLELNAYAPLVTLSSYCVVFDTVIEDMPENSFPERPWGKGNNPKTAVWEYLKNRDDFVRDKGIENKLLITVAPNGFLKKIK